uniref:Putative secreted protein n=1 Tax=Ixodes ricinus TaxID=34613 RepID=A0A6B0UQA4_IXORI
MMLQKSALGACAVSASDHVSCSLLHSTLDWLCWLVSFATVHLNGVEEQAHVVTCSALQQKARVLSYVGGFSVECKLSNFPSHTNVWAPTGTFEHNRIERRVELTEVELTKVYCINCFTQYKHKLSC